MSSKNQRNMFKPKQINVHNYHEPITCCIKMVKPRTNTVKHYQIQYAECSRTHHNIKNAASKFRTSKVYLDRGR